MPQRVDQQENQVHDLFVWDFVSFGYFVLIGFCCCSFFDCLFCVLSKNNKKRKNMKSV